MYDQLRNRVFAGQLPRDASASEEGAAAAEGLGSDARKRRRLSDRVDYTEVSDTVFFRQLEEEEEKEESSVRQAGGTLTAGMAAVAATSELNVTFNNIMMHLRKCCNHPYVSDLTIGCAVLPQLSPRGL